MEAFVIHAHLTEMFQEQARHERFMTIKGLNSCKMVSGSSVSAYVLKMKGHIDTLDKLGAAINMEFATDLMHHCQVTMINLHEFQYAWHGKDFGRAARDA